ncbi:hypothetical protein [Enterococcus sp. BWR-S5]|uniref:hypothetical protein n=1 Tax=Enterococcus sp. BWR-S5 TaxID=2787714 RepID=UPI0019211018|nr:hypothetical protein [Enterococcus sp. BWR-S5]MBL1227252.1 hypothetical protein [Enterococcus sp. BWR-S5]
MKKEDFLEALKNLVEIVQNSETDSEFCLKNEFGDTVTDCRIYYPENESCSKYQVIFEEQPEGENDD